MRFFDGLCFFSPVSLLVRTTAGVSVSEFFLLQALLSFATLFAELPAGAFTDKFGYKATFVTDQALLLAARTLLFVAYLKKSLLLFTAEAMLEGIDLAFCSGTRSAYLYTMLPHGDYAVVSARIDNCGTAGHLAASLAYMGLYAVFGITGLLAATCAADFCALLAVLRLPRDIKPPARQQPKPRVGLARLLRAPRTLGLIALLAASSMAQLLINFFYAEKLLACGLSEIWMSPIIFGYSFIGLLAEHILARTEPGQHLALMALFFVLDGAGMVLFGATNAVYAVVPLMLLLPLLLNVPSYILGEVQNRLVDAAGQEEKRTELLNLFNMGGSVAEIFFLVGSSAISGAGSAACFLGLGAFFIASGAAVAHKIKQ